MDEGKKMLQNVEAELRIGIPKGTSMWPMPRKPMGQAKPGAQQGKPGGKSPVVKGSKGPRGMKSKGSSRVKKGIFGGWD